MSIISRFFGNVKTKKEEGQSPSSKGLDSILIAGTVTYCSNPWRATPGAISDCGIGIRAAAVVECTIPVALDVEDLYQLVILMVITYT